MWIKCENGLPYASSLSPSNRTYRKMRHSIVLSFDVQYTASASLTVGQNDVTADTLLYVLLYNNTTHFQNTIKIRRQLF